MNPELIIQTRNSLGTSLWLIFIEFIMKCFVPLVLHVRLYSNSLKDYSIISPPVEYLCHVYDYCPLSVLGSYLLCLGDCLVMSFSCAHIVHNARLRGFTIKIHTQRTNTTRCRYLVLGSEFMFNTNVVFME